MTDVTNATTKSNTAKPTARAFGPADYEKTAEEGIAQAKDTYDKAKEATEQAADLFRATYATVAKSTSDYNVRIVEIARANTNAAFEFIQKLMGVKSPSEFAELSSAHASKQLDTLITQTKELNGLAQKISGEITGPLTAGLAKAVNNKAA
jgi:phasin